MAIIAISIATGIVSSVICSCRLKDKAKKSGSRKEIFSTKGKSYERN